MDFVHLPKAVKATELRPIIPQRYHNHLDSYRLT
nr:MAG TPA: hypothetical protein [Caudoviricetes sp.]